MKRINTTLCCVVDKEAKKILMVLSKRGLGSGKYNFPGGKKLEDESFLECAIRETEEETGHTCSIINEKEIGILKYLTPAGENVELHLYLAKDTGLVTREINPKDKEETLWVNIEKVKEKILYQDLNQLWLDMKNKINK